MLLATLFATETGRIDLVRPKNQLNEQGEPFTRKVHPVRDMFPRRVETPQQYRSDNFDKLLVLLVDFQEDDNPKTTGNGKFVLEPDPDYPISLGAPPRDYDYFRYNLEAMRYYYLAASLGSYDLKYDIYPQRDGPFFAYTLPNEMAYYNPGFEDGELFVARVEEYFYDVFRVADSYGDIDFSQYGHFLFIHAGSDWQHDVYGDTPHDLPSYFVTVAEGKEAVVNDGTVKISSAANVPETISQDDRYGVINSVMAHEFGHSLGYVDLYNVNNSYPGVGWWDIMDSGGSTRVFMPAENEGDDPISLEGVVPALPSAWHRLISFGEYYEQRGYFKKINEFPQDERIQIAAAGHKPELDDNAPYIVKVPINEYEYVLLENRNIDPDGKGGIALRGAYPLTPGGTDYRVALHPIALDDDDLLEPTYEYDWLLPGWIDRSGYSYGGGIIAWHIDEDIIYNEGVTYDDGTFRSNYEVNRVNTDYYNRGIRIIEADNILDIGNPYSRFWRGTEYEPYFRYEPDLDNDGFFRGWSAAQHNRELSSVSEPALNSKSGSSSLYSIYDISAVAKIMSFRYRFQPFIKTHNLLSGIEPQAIVTPGNSILDDYNLVLPVFTDEGLHVLRQIYQYDHWDLFVKDFDYIPTQGTLTVKDDQGRAVFYVPVESSLYIFTDEGFNLASTEIIFRSAITDIPVVITNDLLVVPTEDDIVLVDIGTQELIQSIPFPDAKLSYNGHALFVISNGEIHQFSVDDTGIISTDNSGIASMKRSMAGSRNNPTQPRVDQGIRIPDYSGSYSPITYKDEEDDEFDILLIQNKQGDIYSFTNELKLFFSLSSYTNKLPTQLAIFATDHNESQKAIALFAAGEYLFAINTKGTMVDGFPKRIEEKEFLAGSYPRIITNDHGQLLAVFESVDDAFFVFNIDNLREEPGLSMLWNRAECNDLLFWDESNDELLFFFADSEDILYQSVWFDDLYTDPIVWNGARHSGRSSFSGTYRLSELDTEKLTAFTYPNPVSHDQVRLRVEGAANELEVRLFDISGRTVYKQEMTGIAGSFYDILIDIKSLSSGLYYGKVESAGRSAKFNLAVEK